MNVLIRTPEGEQFFQERVRSVDVFSQLGAMRLLPGHASLQGTILFSPVRIETETTVEQFAVQQGFVLVDQEKDEVTFLVYRAEKRSELNYETAQQYLEHVMQALKNNESLSEYELKFLTDERLATQERITFLEKKTDESS